MNSESFKEAPSLAETFVPPEAAITAWCRRNRPSSGTVKLFFDLADRGMPLFRTDSEAVSWLSERTDYDPSVTTLLGFMHQEGFGVPKSDWEAVQLYKIAADQGFAAAQYSLGDMHYYHRGVPRSYVEAVRLYRLVADQGYAESQYSPGFMYEKGQGVPQSYEEAERLYRLAADQGDADAQCNFGWMYENGQGVQKSIAEARGWYQKAAAQGENPEARDWAREALKRI